MKLISYLQSTYQLPRRRLIAWIKQGVISVNTIPIESFSHEVIVWDEVRIDHVEYHRRFVVIPSKQLEWLWWYEDNQIILYHKPLWCVVSRYDPHHQTIYDFLPKELLEYYPIGRLDKESSWLLLLTNDLTLVDKIAHPRYGHKKRYQLMIDTPLTSEQLQQSLNGMRVDEQGRMIDPLLVPSRCVNTHHHRLFQGERVDRLYCDHLNQEISHQSWVILITMTLTQWRKRHIRRMMKALKKQLISLHRISFGEYTLGDLKSWEWRSAEGVKNN